MRSIVWGVACLCFVLVLTLGGCPVVSPNGYNMTRLRTACNGFTSGDSDINMLLTYVETDKENGWSKAEELQAEFATCSKYPADIAVPCADCTTEIVNQVWAAGN